MKKLEKKYRYKIIALIISGVMLLPFLGKNKEKIMISMEKFYSIYFTNDDALPTLSQTDDIPEVGLLPKKPVTQNKDSEEQKKNNEDEIIIVDETPKEDKKPVVDELPKEEKKPVINKNPKEDKEPEPAEITKKEDEPKEPEPTYNNDVTEVIDNVDTPQIDEDVKQVAFTFDDGPSIYTEELLEILRINNAKASFFVLGSRIEKYESTIEKMKNEGHQIESHGKNHENFTELTNEELKNILDETKYLLSNYGVIQTLVRPPYGSLNNQVKENIEYPLIMWSLDTRDWEHRNSKQATRIIIENVEDGSIILMHDLYQSTIDAVRNVLPILTEQGYEFVTLNELYEENELEKGKTYYKKIK